MEKREINLNSIVYNEQITREDILAKVNQEQIFTHYIGESIISGTLINSPLRNDNVPSFAIYYHRNGSGTLMFYDFATKDCGDCFVFVSLLFGLNLKETLFKLAFDFGLSDLEIDSDKQKIVNTKRVIQKEQVRIGIKSRKWKMRDKRYWAQFGISKKTLIKYNVIPISHVFFNEDAYTTHQLAYAYVEYKDDQPTYKIYQPLEIKTKKWINNANYSVHQGYTQLPPSGDILIITKSLKDVMSIEDVIGIPSVGLQSESVMMKQSVMDEYKSRFKKVYCLFDNDEAGKKLANSFEETFNIPKFFMPEIEGVTDFSDLVKRIGKEKAKIEFMKKLKL